MLAGLYRPSAGRVRLGHADLWEMDPLLVGSAIGYLPQSVQLFRGTLRSNLNLTGTATDDRLLAVSKQLVLASEWSVVVGLWVVSRWSAPLQSKPDI